MKSEKRYVFEVQDNNTIKYFKIDRFLGEISYRLVDDINEATKFDINQTKYNFPFLRGRDYKPVDTLAPVEENIIDTKWTKTFEKFSEVWKYALEDKLSTANGYSTKLYNWGFQQIKGQYKLEDWKKEALDSIGFVWDNDGYESIFSSWNEKFYNFLEICKADDKELVEKFTMSHMARFRWAEKELLSDLEDWKFKKFKKYGVSSKYTLSKIKQEKTKILQDAAHRKKLNDINNNRLIGDEEGITSIKVIGRKIDYVRNDVNNSIYDCDFYEVRIQICSSFNEDEFKKYVTENKNRFVTCAKESIKEERNKKFITPFLPKLKVDKMVYGLKSHVVTIMFSVLT